MENLRNPMVSRAAALEAAERLQQLAILLEDDGVLKRILSEANRTICQSKDLVRRPGDTDITDRLFDGNSRPSRSRRMLS